MVIGPVVGYIYQYWLIRSKQTLGTFSIDVCGILLFANIMRLNFYIFQQYKTALFFQSVLMVVVQVTFFLFSFSYCTYVLLLREFKDSKCNSKICKPVLSRLFGDGHTLISSVLSFLSLVLFILGFSSLLTGISFLMKELGASGAYGFAIGLIALMVEVNLEV